MQKEHNSIDDPLELRLFSLSHLDNALSACFQIWAKFWATRDLV